MSHLSSPYSWLLLVPQNNPLLTLVPKFSVSSELPVLGQYLGPFPQGLDLLVLGCLLPFFPYPDLEPGVCGGERNEETSRKPNWGYFLEFHFQEFWFFFSPTECVQPHRVCVAPQSVCNRSPAVVLS